MHFKEIEIIFLKVVETKPSQDTEIIPKREKRKSKKESEGSSELCHQRRAWIDQLLSLDPCLVGNGPQGKYVVI